MASKCLQPVCFLKKYSPSSIGFFFIYSLYNFYLFYSFNFRFQIPPPETHNGPLRGFKIAYRLAGVSASSFIIRKIEISSATQGSIDGLLQWTAYEIKVRAYNDAGDGVYSQPITVTTAEGRKFYMIFDPDVLAFGSVFAVLSGPVFFVLPEERRLRLPNSGW